MIDFLVQLLKVLTMSQIKGVLSQLENEKKKENRNNKRVFGKILKFFKLNKDYYMLLFGISGSSYQNKILNVLYKTCKWVLSKYNETEYPKLSIDRQVVDIFNEFNTIQTEEQKKTEEIFSVVKKCKKGRKKKGKEADEKEDKNQKSKDKILSEIEEENS